MTREVRMKTDWEKVIRGLIACKNHWCAECPYAMQGMKCCGRDRMFDDALALLKEQEARVMTLEEVEEMATKSDPDPVCAEWSTGRTGWVIGSIRLLSDMMKNGNREVRVWTSRPSEQQMRETPWKGEAHEKDEN